MNQKRRVIIIGGGAAGLTAAIFAAQEGAAVTLLEQNDHPGKKINVTGNGRCNLTNLNLKPEEYHGTHPEFAVNALNGFSVSDTLDFFRNLGLCTVNKDGWVYPRSFQAKSVTELLVLKARSLKVKLKTRDKAESITFRDGIWFVKTSTWTYEGESVILANGSKASAVDGSDGSGYELAKALGHSVIKPLPALTGLKCGGNHFKGWSGVRTQAKVRFYNDGALLISEIGEVQLTEYGISGIPVFQLSRFASRALEDNHNVSVSLDFFPEYSNDQILHLLREREENCPYQSEAEAFTGLLPDKLIKVIQKQKNPYLALKEFSLEISSTCGFEQAQICCGGVDTSEVYEDSMESKLHKGLYFAGELLDIDGPCGGYNLQWAWSSGAAAGIHAAKEA